MLKRITSIVMAAVIVFAGATGITGCDKNVKITTGLKDDVIFKLSDSECNLSEIMLSLMNEKNKYEKDFGVGIWEKSVDETSMEDNVKSYVKERHIYLEAIYMMSQEEDIEVTDEENEKLKQAAKAYYDTLSEEEKELLNVSEEDVLNVYRKNLLAEKVYEHITSKVQYEVSDEEARVMNVMYIYIEKATEESLTEDRNKAQEAYTKVQSGADFYTLASQYSDDAIIQIEIGRGDMLEEVEKAAFELKNGEYTEIIETEKGFYIVKCVQDYLPDRTESNKKQILQEMKNEEFLEEFEPFLEEQKLDFNNQIWEEINFSEYVNVVTSTLFDVYATYFE